MKNIAKKNLLSDEAVKWNDYALEKEMATLENPMDRGTWQATVNVVAMSWTQMSD